MSQRVELYNFDHGQHRNLTTGKFLPLQPNKLGRPLTHEEMDYNMDYMEQTLGGYKIFGSAPDTTLNASDIDKVLILHRITNDDFDVQRYLDAGFELGDYVWVPVEGGSGYTSGESCTISITVSSSGISEFARATSSIFVTVTGAEGSVLILINGNVVTPSGISGNTYRFDGYGAGTYTITAIDQAFAGTQCSTSRTITIEEGADPCLGYTIREVLSTLSGTDAVIVCNLDGISLKSTTNADYGQANGSIIVEVEGSIDYSSLVWTVDGNLVTAQLVTGNVFVINGIAGGNHSIIVYESGNSDCNAQLTVFVDQNPDDCASFILTGASHTDSGGYECDLVLSSSSSTDSGTIVNATCDSFIVQSTGSEASGGYDCATFVLTGQFGVESGGYDCATFNIFDTSRSNSGGYVCNLEFLSSSTTTSGTDSADI